MHTVNTIPTEEQMRDLFKKCYEGPYCKVEQDHFGDYKNPGNNNEISLNFMWDTWVDCRKALAEACKLVHIEETKEYFVFKLNSKFVYFGTCQGHAGSIKSYINLVDSLDKATKVSPNDISTILKIKNIISYDYHMYECSCLKVLVKTSITVME